MAINDLKDKVCIVGVGQSEFGRVLDVNPLRLQIDAMKNAIEDAGITKDEIDGFVTAQGSPRGIDYDEFVAHTGLKIRWTNQFWAHGRWGSSSIVNAAMAVANGLADVVLVANTTTTRRGYGRHFPEAHGGFNESLRDTGGGHGEVGYHGLDTPGAATSLVARDYMRRYGATSEELGTVAVTFRKHAQLNPHAIMFGRPMTLDDYMESRFISPPFRLFDYCLTNEGANAFIITTPERAKAMKKEPVYITGIQGIQADRDSYIMFARPGMGVGFQREYDAPPPRQKVYDMAGVDHKDIDALYMYDSFSSNLWMLLERYGFCKPGEAHEYIQGGRIELGGELPVNTNGGLMSEGHYSGFNHLVEATRQLRGECGERQVQGAKIVQWATTYGDSLILTKGK